MKLKQSYLTVSQIIAYHVLKNTIGLSQKQIYVIPTTHENQSVN